MGNLTRDPDVRYTPKGNAVSDIGLAVNRNYTVPETGERREEVTFVDVTLWGRQAELAGQYLHKGRSVFIEGRLQLDTWEDKNTGDKRNKLRVVCENMRFIGGRNDAPGGQQGQPAGPPAQQQSAPQQQTPQQQQAPQQAAPPASQPPAPQGPPTQGPPVTQSPPPAATNPPVSTDLDEEDDIPF